MAEVTRKCRRENPGFYGVLHATLPHPFYYFARDKLARAPVRAKMAILPSRTRARCGSVGELRRFSRGIRDSVPGAFRHPSHALVDWDLRSTYRRGQGRVRRPAPRRVSIETCGRHIGGVGRPAPSDLRRSRGLFGIQFASAHSVGRAFGPGPVSTIPIE